MLIDFQSTLSKSPGGIIEDMTNRLPTNRVAFSNLIKVVTSPPPFA